MQRTRIPSPARSDSAVTSRRRTLSTRSVGSPARSHTSGRLTSMVGQFKEVHRDSITSSPLNKTVLTDNTEIEQPRRQSWWKRVNDSTNISEVLKVQEAMEPNNIMDEIEMEVLSQENKNYMTDFPESSGSESISSIVIPQRKLFTQKENVPHNVFNQIPVSRKSVTVQNKTNVEDKTVNIGTKTLFGRSAKISRPIFPAAVSPDKTRANKTNERPAEIETQPRSLFGNRQSTKRKNRFADFIVSESEEEISEIQSKPFAFQRNTNPVRHSTASRTSRGNRETSPTSSHTTDIEMGDWQNLPSSTMVEHEFEALVASTPGKKLRLSKLSEAKESDAGTNSNNTINKTKLSNKSTSKNKSKITPDETALESELDKFTASKSKSSENIEKLVTTSKEQNSPTNKSNANSSKIKNTYERTVVVTEDVIDTNCQTYKINNQTQVLNKTGHGKLSVIDEKSREVTDIQSEANSRVINNQTYKINNDTAKSDLVQNNVDDKNITYGSKLVEVQTENEGLQMKDTEVQIKDVQGKDKEESQVENNKEVQVEDKQQKHVEGEEHEEDLKLIYEEEDQNQSEIEVEGEEEHQQNESGVENKEEVDKEQDNKIEKNVENLQVEEENEEENQNEDELVETDISNKYQESEQDENEKEDHNEEDDVEVNIVKESEQKNKKEEDQNENEDVEADIVTESEQDNEEEENQNEDKDVEADIVQESEQENEEEEDKNEEEDVEADIVQESEQEESEEEGQNEDEDVETDIVTESEQENEEEEIQNEDKDVEADIVQESEQEENEEEGQNEDEDVEADIIQESEQEVNEEESENEDEDAEADIVQESEQEEEEGQNEDETIEVDIVQESQQEENEEVEVQSKNEEVEEDMEQDNEVEIQTKVQESEHEDKGEIDAAQETPESETPVVTHDMTSRHRQTVVHSPEDILRNITSNKSDHSFIIKGRNTSIRKTLLQNFTVMQSEAPLRESTGLDDGTQNSSAEGSGWDSHRTTRKTLRQTFGKDFTPRKSLRALVMEKSAKRQTAINEANAKLRQANSTEIPGHNAPEIDLEFDNDEMIEESDHEISKRMRQATLDMHLQKMKEDIRERRRKIQEKGKQLRSLKTNSIKADFLNLAPRKTKPMAPKAPKASKSRRKANIIPLEYLPEEFINDLRYKPPRRYQPRDASWITKRLYKFLETKLQDKYDYKARVRAERLVETLYEFARQLGKQRVAPPHAVAEIARELARLDVVTTHYEFYDFIRDYMPFEVKIKVIPDIINNLPLPSNGLFSNIID